MRFCRIDPAYADELEREQVMALYAAALAYVLDAYALAPEQADACPDVAVAVLVLTRDMYDNRTMAAPSGAANRTVGAIMASHDANLL